MFNNTKTGEQMTLNYEEADPTTEVEVRSFYDRAQEHIRINATKSFEALVKVSNHVPSYITYDHGIYGNAL